MKNSNARMCAYKILYKIENDNAFSNIAIKEGIAPDMADADRRLCVSIVYGCVKYKRLLDAYIAEFSSVKIKKLSLNVLLLLRIGAYQIFMLERVPDSAAVNECVKLATKLCYRSKGFINALLRKISSNKDELLKKDFPIAVKYSYPDELADMWTERYGRDEAERLMRAGNENPKTTVRVNTLKTDCDTLIKNFAKKGIKAVKIDGCDMLTLENTGRVDSIEEYKNGLFTPQGICSYIAGKALGAKSGQTVIDLCAAPGAKSTHIAEMMKNEGRILSFDIHEHKTVLIDANAKRLGIDIIKSCAGDSSKVIETLKESADAILADVVCSGLGIIHKKPDIRYSFDKNKLKELSELQLKILTAGAAYVKIGGTLLYSTCTISDEENMGVIDRFLKEHNNFLLCSLTQALPEKYICESAKKGYIQFYPDKDGTDGFFICKMERRK